MDFFKSAVASIAKGPAFPYTFGDRVDLDQSIWTLHNGTKREDNSKCSIFSFDINANRSRLPLAKNALRKFRTLRHPGIIRVLDTVETDQLIYIATERVTPLSWSTKRRALSEESIKWGLHSIAKIIKFINDEASSVHGNVRVSSVFTSDSGEWKIGGLEITSALKEDDAVIFTQGSLVPDIGRYSPPEVIKNGWASVKQNPSHAVDAYDFGILISEVFNGTYTGTEQIGSTKNIPTDMVTSYKRLSHAAPKVRLSVSHFLEQGTRSGGFFDTPLIHLTDGIESLGLKTEAERDEFISELETVAESDDFPEDFFKVKVLPELLKSVEFGGGGPKSFSLVMRISQKLSEDEYEAQITPVIVRLFTNSDRALRVCLLDNLPHMIDHLSQKLVTNQIFPQMVTGFGDLAPLVREQTVKAVLVVVPKLTDRVINGELLRHLAKTANDEQPGIRTNTTICLGKIARNLSPSSRAKVLSAAFGRALRDPFVHARNAALLALAATADIYSEEDCATKMMPALCPALVDKEKMIRDQASKTLNIFLDRVQKYSATLPDTALPPADATSGSNPQTRVATPQAGNSWTGWAISSFTNKLSSVGGQIETNGVQDKSATPEIRPASASVTSESVARPPVSSTASAPAVPRAPSNLRHETTSPPIEDDFAGGWGDDDEDAAAADDDVYDPWADPAPTISSTNKPVVSYDDGGEPDFEGWLNAQSQAKTSSKKPLPKGLTKKVATPPALSRTVTPKRTASITPKVVAPAAKTVPKVDDDEDWGEAWG